MNKKLLEELKAKLNVEKENVEKELTKFAKKDSNLKHDWDTVFPLQQKEKNGTDLEGAADEVEEYSTLLSLEYSLENRLKDINITLEKIEKGQYGKCEKCKKNINEERLKIYPAARLCMKCENENPAS